jgi:hypothetical protein
VQLGKKREKMQLSPRRFFLTKKIDVSNETEDKGKREQRTYIERFPMLRQHLQKHMYMRVERRAIQQYQSLFTKMRRKKVTRFYRAVEK